MYLNRFSGGIKIQGIFTHSGPLEIGIPPVGRIFNRYVINSMKHFSIDHKICNSSNQKNVTWKLSLPLKLLKILFAFSNVWNKSQQVNSILKGLEIKCTSVRKQDLKC